LALEEFSGQLVKLPNLGADDLSRGLTRLGCISLNFRFPLQHFFARVPSHLDDLLVKGVLGVEKRD
jgi:hypothetical protein